MPKIFLINFFLLQVFFVVPAFALPSAHDLLQTVQNNTHVQNNTQHLIYKTSTVIQKPGQGPTTVVQTTEIYKQKPDHLKIIINNGVQQSQMISIGDGYLYVQNPSTGTYQPVKAPFFIDPFQTYSNSVTDFDSADTQAVTDASDPPGQGHYEITVRGGKLPKTVDHATLRLDPQANTITHMDSTDVNGNKVMSMDATYQKIGSTYHPQHVHTESHTNKFDVSSDMDVVTNEVDQKLPVSIFAIK